MPGHPSMKPKMQYPLHAFTVDPHAECDRLKQTQAFWALQLPGAMPVTLENGSRELPCPDLAMYERTWLKKLYSQ